MGQRKSVFAGDLNIYAKYVAAGSSSNQIYQDCLMAGSSSQNATETAYPAGNKTNLGNIYLSSATVQKKVGIYVQYPFPSGSSVSGSSLYTNGVLVSSSKQAEEIRYTTSADLHTRGQVNHYITSSASFLIATVSFASASLKDYAYSSKTSHSLSTTDYTDTSLVNDTTLYYYSASVVVSDSLKNLVANTAFSQSVAVGRIVKIVVPFETLKSVIEPTINNIQNITILNYNGVVQSLNNFNTISSSISNGITSNFALIFASASKNDMGSIVNNNINVNLGGTQIKSVSIKKSLAAEGTQTQAFETKYPTNKTNWTTINGVLTSPKNQ
jgi:hypothetical protein